MKTSFSETIKVAAIIELVLAAGIITFWITFFSADLADIDDPHLKEIYLAFESAFPIPDLYLSAVLIIGGIGLLRRMNFGFLFSLLGGASLIFLALLDISFNTQNGIYQLGIGEAILNGIINFLCLISGIFIIMTVWKYKLRR